MTTMAPNVAIIAPDGTVDLRSHLSPIRQARAALGPVDVFSCAVDRLLVGAVYEYSALDRSPHRLNLFASSLYGGSRLYGTVHVWRDDLAPFTAIQLALFGRPPVAEVPDGTH